MILPATVVELWNRIHHHSDLLLQLIILLFISSHAVGEGRRLFILGHNSSGLALGEQTDCQLCISYKFKSCTRMRLVEHMRNPCSIAAVVARSVCVKRTCMIRYSSSVGVIRYRPGCLIILLLYEYRYGEFIILRIE